MAHIFEEGNRRWNSKTLPPSYKKKVKACKNPEDILSLAREEGYELSDEELEALSGGAEWLRCKSFTMGGEPY